MLTGHIVNLCVTALAVFGYRYQ